MVDGASQDTQAVSGGLAKGRPSDLDSTPPIKGQATPDPLAPTNVKLAGGAWCWRRVNTGILSIVGASNGDHPGGFVLVIDGAALEHVCPNMLAMRILSGAGAGRGQLGARGTSTNAHLHRGNMRQTPYPRPKLNRSAHTTPTHPRATHSICIPRHQVSDLPRICARLWVIRCVPLPLPIPRPLLGALPPLTRLIHLVHVDDPAEVAPLQRLVVDRRHQFAAHPCPPTPPKPQVLHVHLRLEQLRRECEARVHVRAARPP